ncbi:DUF1330 domain-containing protein [Terasakiella sp. A23]|uniref:DUF1330 domain-containing protein n=1 Tax=Terasakiella sp. FCG-A23 TaxID=3080561 RepID=UPI002953C3F8|nr:DUF1330 domain-containing protein [Terasakiella sp. A23]MDV7341560.1 DUF1330 domain-containing protein [Terasakiella sp. A23]
MSALMISHITIKDQEKFQRYMQETQKVAGLYGAELVFRGPLNQILTPDEQDHNICVVVKFPSIEAIDEWYNSDAYKKLIPLREEGAHMKMVSYAPAP